MRLVIECQAPFYYLRRTSSIIFVLLRVGQYATLAAVFHVGDVIRKLRGQRGWTIRDLVTHSGVDKMTISGIEHGDNYRRDTVDRIAQAFGLTAARLEARLREWAETTAGPAALSDELRELVEVWNALEPEGRALHLSHMRREAQLVAQARRRNADAEGSRRVASPRPDSSLQGRPRKSRVGGGGR